MRIYNILLEADYSSTEGIIDGIKNNAIPLKNGKKLIEDNKFKFWLNTITTQAKNKSIPLNKCLQILVKKELYNDNINWDAYNNYIKYKSSPNFKNVINQFETTEMNANDFEHKCTDIMNSNLKVGLRNANKDIQTIYNKNGWTVKIPKTFEASVNAATFPFGKTHWCTAASAHYFNGYTKGGEYPLYIVSNGTKEGTYQFCFNKNNPDAKDFNDDDFDIIKANIPDEVLKVIGTGKLTAYNFKKANSTVPYGKKIKNHQKTTFYNFVTSDGNNSQKSLEYKKNTYHINSETGKITRITNTKDKVKTVSVNVGNKYFREACVLAYRGSKEDYDNYESSAEGTPYLIVGLAPGNKKFVLRMDWIDSKGKITRSSTKSKMDTFVLRNYSPELYKEIIKKIKNKEFTDQNLETNEHILRIKKTKNFKPQNEAEEEIKQIAIKKKERYENKYGEEEKDKRAKIFDKKFSERKIYLKDDPKLKKMIESGARRNWLSGNISGDNYITINRNGNYGTIVFTYHSGPNSFNHHRKIEMVSFTNYKSINAYLLRTHFKDYYDTLFKQAGNTAGEIVKGFYIKESYSHNINFKEEVLRMLELLK